MRYNGQGQETSEEGPDPVFAAGTSSLWSSWHICLLDEHSEWKRFPVAQALAAGIGDDPDTAIQKMRLFERLGWPAAKGSLIVEKADDNSPEIGILKCKPSCWRLYFYVYQRTPRDKRILYLLALCKKRNAQRPEDTTRARNLLAAALDGRIKIIQWNFPIE